mmetsp:Transcript_20169/g.26169  ORF Transcript_20169/g.26169 Transcript_20169/m.26169 type:complete len:581 (-) Transcript_20169:804-2546(-)|eukprot:CAMPEP_0184009498 /NCGR_PEP_ID=MMETSP0954-20121128/2638_1 /TAXON_ID=627963 /ORGANISM="Aplanochytrium sp, Strain PBS07" /LENGTH=580 /DNA_ID=CAMNT_0026288877 /DNA_START=39 /DNA_END=1781 /DNA_ORIENTATION=-
MDFESLLGQHTQEQQQVSKSLVENVNALDTALSASREGPDQDNDFDDWENGSRRRGGGRVRGGRYRHRNKRRRFQQKPKGQTFEKTLEGELHCDCVYGEYQIWKRQWGVPSPPDMDAENVEEPGIVVKFKAKGEDNIVVALSPMLGHCDSPGMYEIVIGGWKNTKSIIRRKAQGDECAVSMEPRLCSPNHFTPFWAMQLNGVVSIGIGENVGENIVVAWKDPHSIPCSYVSFTGWDNLCVYKEIEVSTCKDMNVDMMEEVEWSNYVPQYLQNAHQEVENARARAARFGQEFQGMNMGTGLIDTTESLNPADRHLMQLAKSHQNHRDNVATGFDLTTEEEKKKQEDRRKRFNLPEKDSSASENKPEEDFATRDKREQRASRFNVPVMEDFNQINSISQLLSKLRVPRKDPSSEDLKRPESLHVYGPFDGKYTKDILVWFEEYGASHIEWLHDCAVNVLFQDEFTAKRALSGIGKPIPKVSGETTAEATDDIAESQPDGKEIEKIIDSGWLQATSWGRVFLLRQATMTDVKASKDSEYRTHRSFPSRRGGRSVRGGRRRNAHPDVSGRKRSRDSDGDFEMDD